MKAYIKEVSEIFKTGNSTEHSYRPVFKKMLSELLPTNISIINEPKRIDCGAPDFVLTKNSDIPVGYIETKDLDKEESNEQIKRYKTVLAILFLLTT